MRGTMILNLFKNSILILCPSIAFANYPSPWEKAYQEDVQQERVIKNTKPKKNNYYEDDEKVTKNKNKKNNSRQNNNTTIYNNRKEVAVKNTIKRKITASTNYDINNYYEEPVYNPILSLDSKYLVRYGLSIRVRDAGTSYYSFGGASSYYNSRRMGRDREVILFNFE